MTTRKLAITVKRIKASESVNYNYLMNRHKLLPKNANQYQKTLRQKHINCRRFVRLSHFKTEITHFHNARSVMFTLQVYLLLLLPLGRKSSQTDIRLV